MVCVKNYEERLEGDFNQILTDCLTYFTGLLY